VRWSLFKCRDKAGGTDSFFRGTCHRFSIHIQYESGGFYENPNSYFIFDIFVVLHHPFDEDVWTKKLASTSRVMTQEEIKNSIAVDIGLPFGSDRILYYKSCYEGEKKLTNHKSPIIRYVVQVEENPDTGRGTYRAVIQVIHITRKLQAKTQISDLGDGMNADKVCSSEYVSKVELGQSFAHVWYYDIDSKTDSLDGLALEEKGDSDQTDQFFAFVEKELKKIQTFNGRGFESRGVDAGWKYLDTTPRQSFIDFRVYAKDKADLSWPLHAILSRF